MSKRVYIQDLTIAQRFTLDTDTVMTVTGKATMGNLTRVSYLTDSGPEYSFTKVNLTTCTLI